MTDQPLINITVPVFNRLEETRKTILSIRKNTLIPHAVTAVNNGSDPEVREILDRLADSGMIDNLFHLDGNYGVSCAVNTGWKLVHAPLQMKLDNDMEIIQRGWLGKILSCWKYLEQPSFLGPFWGDQRPVRAGRAVETPAGTVWEAEKTLPGAGLIIPQEVLDTLGYLSEDYGIYGEEDADYSIRGFCSGFHQYGYDADPVLRDNGLSPSPYLERNIDKDELRRKNVGKKELGLYRANELLFKMCARRYNVPLKYRVDSVEGRNVRITTDPAYFPFRKRLLEAVSEMNRVSEGGEKLDLLVDQSVVIRLKTILGTQDGCSPTDNKGGI